MSGRGRARGRGRGRGASRGRGGSRGRGRGGSGGRGAGRGGRGGYVAGRQHSNASSDDKTIEVAEVDVTLDIHKDIKKFFVGTASFSQHFDAQNENKQRYAAGMAVLEKSGVEISQNARARGLAAAWARQDHDLADSLLINRQTFGLVEVLKALTILDSARRIREEEKRLKKMFIQTGGKVKPKIMGKFKSNIDNLTANKPKIGSASGAVCKHVRNWVRQFTKKELEFYALHFPTDPWKKLADICHFHPEKDFPNLPWFLGFCFGNPAPEGSMVESCRDVTSDNVNELLEEHAVPYSHVKSLQGTLSDESKGRIAQTDKLDQILWYYEDLQCSQVDEILSQRLIEGEKVSLATGKLLERLLTIKMIRENIGGSRYSPLERNKNPTKAQFIRHLIPQAQERLRDIRLILDTPVVVMGDRSSSMEVAIRTSTIIASLLTAICGAKLVFFDHENMVAPFIPTNIEEVLDMAVTIQTGGSTKPAASLYPFYEAKEVLRTIIMVTDEEENGSIHNMRFAELFKKYRKEVSPHCKLVFVSFLRTQHATGQMVNELHGEGIHDNLIQFKLDQSRPDLTKLDKLFGLLSTETSDFEEQICEMMINMEKDGLCDTFKKLQLERDGSTGMTADTATSASGGGDAVPVPRDAWGDGTTPSGANSAVVAPIVATAAAPEGVSSSAAQQASADDWCVVDTTGDEISVTADTKDAT